MLSKNVVTAVSNAVKAEGAVACAEKLTNNIYCQPSRDSPNGEQLKDGAIQR